MTTRTARTTSSAGFTLVELLVAVGIIGVLAAIAVPQYSSYKSRAVDSQMKSALANARTAMEGYYVQFAIYPADDEEAVLPEYGYNETPAMLLDIIASDAVEFELCACTNGGTSACFQYNSTAGKMFGASGCS